MIYVGSSGSERGEHLPRTHKFIAAVSVLEGVCRHLELPHVVRQGCKVVYSPTYPPLLSTGFDFLVVFFFLSPCYVPPLSEPDLLCDQEERDAL